MYFFQTCFNLHGVGFENVQTKDMPCPARKGINIAVLWVGYAGLGTGFSQRHLVGLEVLNGDVNTERNAQRRSGAAAPHTEVVLHNACRWPQVQ